LSDLRHVTERIEREEFARGHIALGDTPAVPRPAATIVLAWAEPGTTTYRVRGRGVRLCRRCDR